jgi:hypothetical protein
MKPAQWSDEQFDTWQKWLAERPPIIRELAEKFPPWKRYIIRDDDSEDADKTSRFAGYPVSYDENGTVTVTVESPFFPRMVFGLKPEDLIEES